METVVRFITSKNINPGLLKEEIAVSYPGIRIRPDGFDRSAPGSPIFEPSLVQKVIQHTPPITTVEPGEVAFDKPNPWTPAHKSNLTSLIAAHDATGTTAEQDERALDAADLAQLGQDFANFAALSDPEKFEVLRKSLRWILRESGEI